jgi:predicted GH43/DUF377 family glycosyl hydrolase
MPAPFEIRRLGVIMEGDPRDPNEAWGVLNPACARGRDGELYLFPRVVADRNLSRVGVARVVFDSAGDPVGVRRMGYALEPEEPYERNSRTAGCEDPRVTFVEALDLYVMTYTAFGPLGPRIALAVSSDLLEWRKLGPVSFTSSHGVDFNLYHNKDALIFPELVRDPRGAPSLGLIHRPTYSTAGPGPDGQRPWLPSGVTEERPSMWLSYCPIERLTDGLEELTVYGDHRLLATPQHPWEALKIGGGAPPVLTPHGWLVLFHGVSGEVLRGVQLQPNVHYCGGALVLDREDPSRVLYRSPAPILSPATHDERVGLVSNVVFPTAVDERGDGRVDVYYGMADSRIGVGRLDTPAALPANDGARIAA